MQLAGAGVRERARVPGGPSPPAAGRCSTANTRPELELRLLDVELDVAEAVDVEHVRHERPAGDLRPGQLERDQLARIARLAHVRQRRSAGQLRRHRREDVAAVERRRHRLERETASSRCRPPRPPRRRAPPPATAARCRVRPASARPPPAARPPAARRRRPGRRPRGGRRPAGTAARRAGSPRPARTSCRAEPVGEVDHPRLRADPGDHAVADADELVLEPVVRQERDDRNAHGPFAASATSASTSPSMSWRRRLDVRLEPVLAQRRARDRADADQPRARVRSRRRRRPRRRTARSRTR